MTAAYMNLQEETYCNLNSANLPPTPKTVIPEAVLIGNPASNRLKLWIPDKGLRG